MHYNHDNYKLQSFKKTITYPIELQYINNMNDLRIILLVVMLFIGMTAEILGKDKDARVPYRRNKRE